MLLWGEQSSTTKLQWEIVLDCSSTVGGVLDPVNSKTNVHDCVAMVGYVLNRTLLVGDIIDHATMGERCSIALMWQEVVLDCSTMMGDVLYCTAPFRDLPDRASSARDILDLVAVGAGRCSTTLLHLEVVLHLSTAVGGVLDHVAIARDVFDCATSDGDVLDRAASRW